MLGLGIPKDFVKKNWKEAVERMHERLPEYNPLYETLNHFLIKLSIDVFTKLYSEDASSKE